IVLNKKVGEHVEKGENILTIHTNTKKIDDILNKLDNSITIESKGEAPTLIHKIITE
ncbi:MAG: pyrimidine-nucleoside phosphorylase, partial [Staphylococcus epidermidis]|nr:pyrimidine-nucleoside phosphorylase [Staphylococcus epidermidis]